MVAIQLNPNPSFSFGIKSTPPNYSLQPSSSRQSFSCGQNSASLSGLNLRVTASASSTDPIVSDEQRTFGSPSKKKLGVVVKPLQKPRIVLKFIWMEKDIGIALDQTIPGYGTIPLSPYYFWPRKDAWEELKVLLESKPWISEFECVRLLNQATDIINLWQANGGGLS